MGRAFLERCPECGAKLNLYVVGVCERCTFDLTGEDDSKPHPWEPWPEVEPEE